MTEIRLGNITGSHGVKGWLKVYSYTKPVEEIFDYSPWILRKGEEEEVVVVEYSRVNGKSLLARIEGVNSRNLADELSGYEIHVKEAALRELEEGDFYWYQLKGLVVLSKEGKCFGKVGYIIETGANDVMVVRPNDESIDNQERLIPYVDSEVVVEVDRETGKIVVDWQADF